MGWRVMMQTNSPSVLKEHHCLSLSTLASVLGVSSLAVTKAEVLCSLTHSITVLNNKACPEKQSRCLHSNTLSNTSRSPPPVPSRMTSTCSSVTLSTRRENVKMKNAVCSLSQYQIYTAKMKFNCSSDLLPVTPAQYLK